MRVVIVGAGLGGLSAACHLCRWAAQHSHSVTVLEQAGIPGGRAGRLSLDGYLIDPGPVVLTMPEYLRDTFSAAGTAMEDHLLVRPLDPMYRAVYADGSVIYVRHGREAMTEEIRRVCGTKEADQFGRFCNWLTDLYRTEVPNFVDRNFDSPVELFWPPGPGLRLLRLGGLSRLHRLVSRYFRDERLQRIFSFQALYAGLSPFSALGAYAVITYMDSINGVFTTDGGMHAVALALAAAAEAEGVEIRYGTSVTEVTRRNSAVSGVRLADGSTIDADVVVINADLPVAYERLLPGLPPPRSLRNAEFSPSCILWLAGARGPLPEGAAHHNIHFGQQWRESFDALLRDGVAMPDPSILVTVPTVSDPSLAPTDGAHVVYALEPVPNLKTARGPFPTAAQLRDRVKALGYPSDVDVEAFLDPREWERQGMAAGTPFALSHRFSQTGPFRPANVDRRVPGLVFVGSSTVPGVGVPMVILSGRLAAARVRDMTWPATSLLRAGRRGKHR